MSAPDMCDKERLIDYLYEEDGPAERHVMEAHLSTCRECAREVRAFRGVREQLAGWDAPEVDLGFRITREPLVGSPRVWWPVPAWAQAMAAVLLLIVGAALANVDVRYGGFALRVGWDAHGSASPSVGESASVATSASAVSDAHAAERAWRAELDGLARELRAELRAASAADPGEAATARGDRDALVGQVRALIAESERRQQRELALRLTQVMHDLERQRRTDLVRIEQNLGQLEGFTGAEAARQRELLNYLVRVSQQR